MPEPQEPPSQVRYNRKWFIVIAGSLVAGFVGVFTAFRRLSDGAGGAAGGPAGGLSSMLSDFPVRSVEDVPGKTLDDWVITVDGLVDNPLRLDAGQWRSLERLRETVDFRCVEGWGVDDVKWAGVAPGVLLTQARAHPDAKFVNFHAFTGEYVDTLPLDLVQHPQTVLADTLNGEPLPGEHGGPVRLVVPVQLGYKSVKWVVRLEVTDKPAVGYWEKRGYPSDAPV